MIGSDNLDMISAQFGFSIPELFKQQKEDLEKIETLANKALGIIIGEGLLAYAVWLKSRSEKEKKYAKVIENKSLELLKSECIKLTNKEDLTEAALEISESIQKTLLARQLLERMLVYARYRAKAMQKGD